MSYRRDIITSETNSKPLVARRAWLLLIIIITAVLQNTGIFPPRIFGVSALPLLPLAICISMFEREWAGIILCVVAGVFCDIPMATGDGFYAIFFLIVCFISGLLITSRMRNNLLTASLIGFVACMLQALTYWLIFYAFKGYGQGLFFEFYLPSAIYSFLFVPFFYFIVRAVFRKYQTEI